MARSSGSRGHSRASHGDTDARHWLSSRVQPREERTPGRERAPGRLSPLQGPVKLRVCTALEQNRPHNFWRRRTGRTPKIAVFFPLGPLAQVVTVLPHAGGALSPAPLPRTCTLSRSALLQTRPGSDGLAANHKHMWQEASL